MKGFMEINGKHATLPEGTTILDYLERNHYVLAQIAVEHNYVILDREDYIEDSYVFEVSSPGLGRPLKKEKDYVRNMGKKIEIRTYRAIDRCKEFTGILKAYDDTSVTIADENDKETTFLKTDIALIRQAIDF